MAAKTKFKKLMIDTAPFIYFIEEHERYAPLIEPIFDQIDAQTMGAITSTITLLEVLVQPIKQQNEELESKYLDILVNNSSMDLISINAAISQKAAQIRAKYDIKVPDAAQLACGILNDCDVLLTHDKLLKRVKEIQVITLDDLAIENET